MAHDITTSAETSGTGLPGTASPDRAVLLHGFAAGLFIIAMNVLFELKDRWIYEYFYASLNNCEWLGCFLISDAVRSPVFLSLIIGGHRLGLDFNVTFTLISLLSITLFTKGVRDLADPMANSRYLLVSMTLGVWLYLIQVKLFLAVALYLYSMGRPSRWQRILFAIAAVLTHESIMFFIGLHFLWRPSEFRISMRSMLVLGTIVVLLVVYLGASSNVLVSTLYKIQAYNTYAETGEVPTMSRIGPFSLLILTFGMIGLLRLKISPTGSVNKLELKSMCWMFLPWVILMVFAGNEVFAIRLSELALLHALLFVPMTPGYAYPSRIGLVLFAATFGMLTLVRDVILFN